MKKSAEEKGRFFPFHVGGILILILFSFSSTLYGGSDTDISGKYDPVMYVEGIILNPCKDYNMVGTIDEINIDGAYMVIDDTFYKFSSKITYSSQKSSDISIYNFKAGQKVGIIVNGNDELAAVCLME